MHCTFLRYYFCSTQSEAIEVFARCVRKKLHLSFYKLGFKLQRHFILVAICSFAILAVTIWIPLKKGLTIETDIESMWVACKCLNINFKRKVSMYSCLSRTIDLF